MRTTQDQSEATYLRVLPDLQPWAGCFVLVRDSKLAGIFSSYGAAAQAWMAMYGPVPALIRRIERLPHAAAATRVRPTAPPVFASRPDHAASDVQTAEVERRMKVFSQWAFGTQAAASTRTFAA